MHLFYLKSFFGNKNPSRHTLLRGLLDIYHKPIQEISIIYYMCCMYCLHCLFCSLLPVSTSSVAVWSLRVSKKYCPAAFTSNVRFADLPGIYILLSLKAHYSRLTSFYLASIFLFVEWAAVSWALICIYSIGHCYVCTLARAIPNPDLWKQPLCGQQG